MSRDRYSTLNCKPAASFKGPHDVGDVMSNHIQVGRGRAIRSGEGFHIEIGYHFCTALRSDLIRQLPILADIQEDGGGMAALDRVSQGGHLLGRGRRFVGHTGDDGAYDGEGVCLREIAESVVIGDEQPLLRWNLGNLSLDPGIKVF